jgi:PBP1b-binding outer membrane lipoprotein LpoB
MALILLFVALLFSACVSPAFDYAKARNPNCEVTALRENAQSVSVLVECPDEPAFQRSYKKK